MSCHHSQLVMQLDRKRIEGVCVEREQMEKKVVTSYEEHDADVALLLCSSSTIR